MPALSRAWTSAPWASKVLATAVSFPHRIISKSGVRPSRSLAFTSAPRASQLETRRWSLAMTAAHSPRSAAAPSWKRSEFGDQRRLFVASLSIAFPLGCQRAKTRSENLEDAKAPRFGPGGPRHGSDDRAVYP